ncbi:YciI family protein [Saccharospirillum salsuginis]|uniref:PhnB protein n=1 Tax=Saccharospirillum salsuginis TaxID=418750 RepID=A0A918K568_9GAMM|nr:YciI family protein [Saccharospirillum salsuginis]GGX47111.1 hypothetical protein GCM10007392_12390 [Saccharospirillum salsuginis]
MRFMILRKADDQTEAGVMPGEALIEAMANYNDRLINAGAMVTGEGLKPTREAVRITFKNGEPVVTDGPFAETKELLAGYTLIDVASREEAIEWARQWPPEDGDGNATIELRPVYGLEDFEPGPAMDHITHQFEREQRQPTSGAIHLSFDGNCSEAFDFYAECLGGQILDRFLHGETPAGEEVPDNWQDKVLHTTLSIGKLTLMGADAPPGYYQSPQGFNVQLDIDDPDKAKSTFERLAEGGEVFMPFEETFWARGFGMARDRFGIPWMINSGKK